VCVQAASPGKAYLLDQQAHVTANMLAKRQYDERLCALSRAAHGRPDTAANSRGASASPSRHLKPRAPGSAVAAAAAAVDAAAAAARAAEMAAAAGTSGGRLSSSSSPSRAQKTPKARREKHGATMRRALRASSSRVQHGVASPSTAGNASLSPEQKQHAYPSQVFAGGSSNSSPRWPAAAASAGNAAAASSYASPGNYVSPGSGGTAPGYSPGTQAAPGRTPGSAGSALQKTPGSIAAAKTALAQFWVSGMRVGPRAVLLLSGVCWEAVPCDKHCHACAKSVHIGLVSVN
jgi:hypothetical protein